MRPRFRDGALAGRRSESWSREHGPLMTPGRPLVTAEGRGAGLDDKEGRRSTRPSELVWITGWLC